MTDGNKATGWTVRLLCPELPEASALGPRREHALACEDDDLGDPRGLWGWELPCHPLLWGLHFLTLHRHVTSRPSGRIYYSPMPFNNNGLTAVTPH